MANHIRPSDLGHSDFPGLHDWNLPPQAGLYSSVSHDTAARWNSGVVVIYREEVRASQQER